MLYNTVVHNGDPVGDRHSFFLIVSYINSRYTDLALDVLDCRSHLNPELCIKVRQRLIHEQNIRLHTQSSCKSYSLLLTAGKRLRHSVGILIDLHEAHELLCAAFDLLL